MKKLKYFLFFLVLLCCATSYLVREVAPYAILTPMRRHVDQTPENLGLHSEALTILTSDSVALQGYAIQANTDTAKATIILVHGIGGCKEFFLELAASLADAGYASFVFDGRAQGQSGGQYCTYGFFEKQDVKTIVDTLLRRNPTQKIGIWGHSLGGAIALQALEADKRLQFGIIESTFADLSQIVFDYKKRYLHGFGVRWISDWALARAGAIAGFDPGMVKPVESAKHIDQPVLIAHGDADHHISVAYGKLLYEQLKSPLKELIIVPGGGHRSFGRKNTDDYRNKVLRFLSQSVRS